MPSDVNDSDIKEDEIQEPSSHPTGMSLVIFKLRLFDLTTQVCSRLSDTIAFDEASLNHYHKLIEHEQEKWNSVFLPDGSPSILNTANYAYWWALQIYAHQLYLLIHRPFYHSKSSRYIPLSRKVYLESSIALLDLHRRICELPTLRPYRWLVNGMTSFIALQAVVALAACLLDEPGQDNATTSHRELFDSTVRRIGSLQESSPICAKAYPALQNLLAKMSTMLDGNTNNASHYWSPDQNLLDVDWVDWTYWDSILSTPAQCDI